MFSKTRVIAASVVSILTFGLVSTSHAEQYIFSAPSATVTDKGSLYCEGDAIPATSSAAANGFMGRCMAGLAKGLEVGVNTLGFAGGPQTAGELQPNIKYQWLSNDRFQIATGVTGYLPAWNTKQEKGFADLYTVGRFQTSIAGAYSPAFSAGGWALVGGSHDTGSRAGVILGVEQPLLLDKSGAPQLTFVMDWMSGNQTHSNFSALTPGLILNLPHDWVVASGFSISNISSKYDAPVFFVGKSFKF